MRTSIAASIAPVNAFDWLVTAALFLAPTLVLTMRGGAGYCYFALLALSLGSLVMHRHDRLYFAPLRRYRGFTLAMLAFPCAIIIQQLAGHFYIPRQFEAHSRFLFVLPVFIMLCQVSSRQLRALGWGCAAGAILAGGWAAWSVLRTGLTDTARFSNTFTNPIPFGDTALLLAFLSLFTLGWDRDAHARHSPLALTIKGLGLLAGGYVSYLSGTRGGWLAIPVFVVLLGFQFHWFTHWKRIVLALAVVALGAVALFSTSLVEQRVGAASADLTELQQGNTDTAVGLRYELWKASWRLYTEHPVFGVGKGHLERALADLASRGRTTPDIINERAHSDFFSTIAEMGTIGLACLLLFYGGVVAEFLRACRRADAATAAACYAGLAVMFSTIIYGLTIDVLVPVMNTTLLALLFAGFLAMVEARRREMGISQRGISQRGILQPEIPQQGTPPQDIPRRGISRPEISRRGIS
jgi:O-antigen ligase